MRISFGWILLMILCAPLLKAQEYDVRLSLHLKQAGFEAYVRSVENQSGHHFYFNQAWVEDLSVDLDLDSIKIESSLRQVLVGTGLYYQFIAPDRWIILPDRMLNTNIAHLMHSDQETTTLEGTRQAGLLGQSMEVSKPEQIVASIVVGSSRGSSSRSGPRII